MYQNKEDWLIDSHLNDGKTEVERYEPILLRTQEEKKKTEAKSWFLNSQIFELEDSTSLKDSIFIFLMFIYLFWGEED